MNYSFLRNIEKSFLDTRLEEIPSSINLRVAAYMGLGGNPFVAIDSDSKDEIDLGVAFYFAGLAAFVHSQGDTSTHEAIIKRILRPEASSWLSSYILHTDLKRYDSDNHFESLLKATRQPGTARLTIKPHRANALLISHEQDDVAEQILKKVFTSITDKDIGIDIAMEYVYVFKNRGDLEKFNVAFTTAQQNLDDAENWRHFLALIDVVDFAAGFDGEANLMIKRINKIQDWKFKLKALTFIAENNLELCNDGGMQWALSQIHLWHTSPKNPYSDTRRMILLINALGDIESTYVNITNVLTRDCSKTLSP